MVNLIELESGNLKVELTDIDELTDVISRGQDERDALFDMLERTGLIGNGWSVPFNVGLTETPAIAYMGDYNDEGNLVDAEKLWYYNQYMVKAYLDELRCVGFVVFRKHDNN